MHNLNSGNYNTMLKETREDLNKWKNTHIYRFDVVKWGIHSGLIYRFNTAPTVIMVAALQKLILKLIWSIEGPRIV